MGLAQRFTDVAAVHPLAQGDGIEAASRPVDSGCSLLVSAEQFVDHLAQGPGAPLGDVPLIVVGREVVQLAGGHRR